MNVPMKTGYYWAKWRIPSDDTPENERACPSNDWEIVQVNENTIDAAQHPELLESLSVSVCGVSVGQWRDCFVWGDFVAPLRGVL